MADILPWNRERSFSRVSGLDFLDSQANHQWHANGAVTLTEAQIKAEKKVYYLAYAFGSGLQVTNDGVDLLTAPSAGSLDFSKFPLRLSEKGFSITGTITGLIGFWVRVDAHSPRPPIDAGGYIP